VPDFDPSGNAGIAAVVVPIKSPPVSKPAAEELAEFMQFHAKVADWPTSAICGEQDKVAMG